MAGPSFLQFAQATPGGALPGALQSGMSTYGALEQMQQKKVAAERAAQMDELKRRASEMALQNMPEKIAAEKREAYLKTEGLAHKNVIDRLNIDQTKHALYSHGLADLAQYPNEQKPKAYQQLRSKMLGDGYDTSNMPEQYGPEVEQQIKTAVSHTPEAAELRKFNRDLMLKKLAGEQSLGKQKQELLLKGTPEQQARVKAAASSNQKYYDQVGDAAQNALTIKTDVDQIMTASGEIPERFGRFVGDTIRLNSTGQLAFSRMQKMILDLFAQMPHVGRGGQLLIETIKTSKLSPNMDYSALKKLAQTYRSAAQYTIEHNNFVDLMKDQGIYDRNKIQKVWNKFNERYPSMVKGEVQPEQATKWPQFLRENPQFLGKQAASKQFKGSDGRMYTTEELQRLAGGGE